MPESEIRRYRFGPLERRGLIGSLRATQVVPMAVSLAAAVVLMRTLPSGAGLFAALGLVLAVAAFCFWPVSGRSAEEWLPIVIAHTRRRALGRHRRASLAPVAGVRVGEAGRPEPAAVARSHRWRSWLLASGGTKNASSVHRLGLSMMYWHIRSRSLSLWMMWSW